MFVQKANIGREQVRRSYAQSESKKINLIAKLQFYETIGFTNWFSLFLSTQSPEALDYSFITFVDFPIGFSLVFLQFLQTIGGYGLTYWFYVCKSNLIKHTLKLCVYSSSHIYRVAAIFPERFQCLTVALKNNLFYYFFLQNRLSCLLKHNYKQTVTFQQR